MKFLFFAIFGISMASLSVRAGSNNTHFKRVVTIYFENMDFKTAMKSKVLKNLASQGALFDNLFAAVHPSQGNYMSITAGSDFGIVTDSNIDLNQSHIGDQLEAHGYSWRVYAEDFPGNCFTGARSGLYARKHNPFISFLNVSRNSQRCANIVDGQSILTDFANGQLADYSFWVPNMTNDGHDGGIKAIDKWVTSTLNQILNNGDLMRDTLVIVTFDESSYTSNNRVYTVALGAGIPANTVNHQKLTHPDLLTLVQTEFGLGSLPNQKSTTAITGLWKN